MFLKKMALLFIVLSILIIGCAGIGDDDYNNGYDIIKEESYEKLIINIENYIDLNTEEYGKIIENNFINTLETPLSTFSIDVDTASYSNVRRFLELDQLPPKDSVRIEELVNYFNYDYESPIDEKPFALNFELAECFWKPENKLLKIGLKGKDVNLNIDDVSSSHLIFLIDVSGSMGDLNKLSLLKSSFDLLLNELREEDKISIITYSNNVDYRLEPTSGKNKEKIMEVIDSLYSSGSTAGAAALEKAYEVAQDNYIENGNNRIILATDGDFNVGISSDDELVNYIAEKREKGIYLSVLGFGMGNLKDSMMEKISNAGNGNYAYIDNILEAKKVFVDQFWGTMYTIAKDVKIQIEFNPKYVKEYRLIGYANRLLNEEDFNDDNKDAGDIGSGHNVTAFYEIVPKENVKRTTEIEENKNEYQDGDQIIDSNNFMTFKIRYKEPLSDESNIIEFRPTEDEIFKEEPSLDFKFASSVVEFGLILRDSDYKGESNIDSLIKRSRNNKGEDINGYRAEFINLAERLEILKK